MNSGFSNFSPQAISAAATVLSRQYTSEGIGYQTMGCWKAKLLLCSRVDVATELAPCMARLSALHAAEHGSAYRFVNKKYMWHGLHGVAKIKPNPPADAAHFAAFMSREEAFITNHKAENGRSKGNMPTPRDGLHQGMGSPQ